MNRRTKKKLKQEIHSLKHEVYDLTIRLHMANMFRIKPIPFAIKAVVPIRECLYPERAYPILRNKILRELEVNIDDFIEAYRDDYTGNHVAVFKFIPTFRKEKK